MDAEGDTKTKNLTKIHVTDSKNYLFLKILLNGYLKLHKMTTSLTPNTYQIHQNLHVSDVEVNEYYPEIHDLYLKNSDGLREEKSEDFYSRRACF